MERDTDTLQTVLPPLAEVEEELPTGLPEKLLGKIRELDKAMVADGFSGDKTRRFLGLLAFAEAMNVGEDKDSIARSKVVIDGLEKTAKILGLSDRRKDDNNKSFRMEVLVKELGGERERADKAKRERERRKQIPESTK